MMHDKHKDVFNFGKEEESLFQVFTNAFIKSDN